VEKLLEETKKRSQGISSIYELEIQRPNGQKRTLLVTATPYFDHQGKFLGSVGGFHDITYRKQLEDRLRYENTHDALTNLFNRRFLEEEIQRLEKSPNQFPISFLMIDANNLKAINDKFGHDVGDQAIKRIGEVLKRSLRREDMNARVRGDEFIVLMLRSDEATLQRVIERIGQAITEENQSHQNLFQLEIAIGGATCTEPGNLNATILLADQKMYADKQEKKARRMTRTLSEQPSVN